MTTFAQKNLIAGIETGSLVNHIQSGNATVPVVGQGGTQYLWSDRRAFEVIDIRKGGKEVDIQYYNARLVNKDGLGIYGNQEYKFEELVDGVVTLHYHRGAWRIRNEVVYFEDSYYENSTFEDRKYLCDENGLLCVVEPGKSYKKTEYSKVSVCFGRKDAHYDPTF